VIPAVRKCLSSFNWLWKRQILRRFAFQAVRRSSEGGGEAKLDPKLAPSCPPAAGWGRWQGQHPSPQRADAGTSQVTGICAWLDPWAIQWGEQAGASGSTVGSAHEPSAISTYNGQ